MNNWICKKIEQNPQLQEFIEKSIGYLFDMISGEVEPKDGIEVLNDVTDLMDCSIDELMWLFEQMEYRREEVEDGEEEN